MGAILTVRLESLIFMCCTYCLRMENSPESFNLLMQLGNDCYRMGEFWYAAKAFDTLNRLDPNPEFWEGKRGAIVGVFQVIFKFLQ